MRAIGFVGPLLGLLSTLACQVRPADQAADPQDSCEGRKQDLIATLERLPEQPVGSLVRVQLPESSLGESLGPGPVLEVTVEQLRLDGVAVEGRSDDERRQNLDSRLSTTDGAAGLTVYVAAPPDLEVRELRRALALLPEGARSRLLFRAPPVPLSSEKERTGYELAAKLLAERDPAKRQALANKGYRSFSKCDAIEDAVARVEDLKPSERWPQLRKGLIEASQSCSCDSLRAGDLKHLVVAEQRAGSMAFGSIPLTFLRDERCGASMPRRSIQKLLTQIEDFDAEFAGGWQEDALAFDQVVTSERLLNYFCDALPGETFSSLSRARSTLYFRGADSSDCQAWTLSQLASGSPMGTWTRKGGEPLALHYWQGAEEIRIFGPADKDSRPTDEREWSCNQTLRMVSIDSSSIELDHGRWFFDAASCQSSSPEAKMTGCVGRLVSGEPALSSSALPDSTAASEDPPRSAAKKDAGGETDPGSSQAAPDEPTNNPAIDSPAD